VPYGEATALQGAALQRLTARHHRPFPEKTACPLAHECHGRPHGVMTLNDRRDELCRMAERSCLEAHTHRSNGAVGKACRLMWRLVWSPKASSKCLISQAVAVVEVKICRGVYGDNTVVIEGSQRGSMGLLLSTDLHTVTHEQNQILIEMVNRHMPATPRLSPHQSVCPPPQARSTAATGRKVEAVNSLG